jgi:hypothetical protein
MVKETKSTVSKRKKSEQLFQGEPAHNIMLTLTVDLHKRLKETADILNTPVATLIRYWIVEKLEEREARRAS